MVDKATSVFLQTFTDEAPVAGFLSSLRTRTRRFNSQKVTIDIEREDEDVAIVIDDLQDPGRANSADLYQNNEFLPPIYKEVAPITAWNLLERRPGQNPHTDPSFQANLARDTVSVAGKMVRKIQRAFELQASQVLQTGVVSLTDAAGNVRYTIDYTPKVSHFPTTGTPWSGGGSVPITDLENLGYQVHEDGRGNPNRLVFGRIAWSNFIKNSGVLQQLDNRRINNGALNPPANRGGGVFHGDLTIGPWVVECWTYSGQYKDPQSGAITRFVEDDKVIMLSDNTRLDACFGALPYVARPEQRAMRFMPDRMAAGGVDMTTNAWIEPDNSALNLSVGTRPLFVPVAIDTYGALKTEA